MSHELLDRNFFWGSLSIVLAPYCCRTELIMANLDRRHSFQTKMSDAKLVDS